MNNWFIKGIKNELKDLKKVKTWFAVLFFVTLISFLNKYFNFDIQTIFIAFLITLIVFFIYIYFEYNPSYKNKGSRK